MPIISRQTEIQEQLINTTEDLQNDIHELKQQVSSYRILYNKACTRHIESGYQKEWLLDKIVDKYEKAYMTLDILNVIYHTLSEYRDLDGLFLDYIEMADTLEHIMIRYADKELYEAAAILKKWLERIQSIVFVETSAT